MITCGSFPPLSINGKTFIHDPKLLNENEVKASIKLKFTTPKGKEILVVKNFQLSVKSNKKYEFKRLEQLIKSVNSDGQLVTINTTVDNIDKQIPHLMHASKAMLENVIFCHQEDSLWPFSESGILKKVFDDIFDTAKYTKTIDELKEQVKKYNSQLRDIKNKSDLIKKDYDNYIKSKHNYETTSNSIEIINSEIIPMKEEIRNLESKISEIIELEKLIFGVEKEIYHKKGSINIKEDSIKQILSNNEFVNYTKSEDEFNEYCNKFKSISSQGNFEQAKVDSLNAEKINISRQLNTIKNDIERCNNMIDWIEVKNNNLNQKKIEIINYIYNDKNTNIDQDTNDTNLKNSYYNNNNNQGLKGIQFKNSSPIYNKFGSTFNYSSNNLSNNFEEFSNKRKSTIFKEYLIKDTSLEKINIIKNWIQNKGTNWFFTKLNCFGNKISSVSINTENNFRKDTSISSADNIYTKSELMTMDLNTLISVLTKNEKFYLKKKNEFEILEKDKTKLLDNLLYEKDGLKNKLYKKEEEIKAILNKRNSFLRNSNDNNNAKEEINRINFEIEENQLKIINFQMNLNSIESNLEKDNLILNEKKKLLNKSNVNNNHFLNKIIQTSYLNQDLNSNCNDYNFIGSTDDIKMILSECSRFVMSNNKLIIEMEKCFDYIMSILLKQDYQQLLKDYTSNISQRKIENFYKMFQCLTENIRVKKNNLELDHQEKITNITFKESNYKSLITNRDALIVKIENISKNLILDNSINYLRSFLSNDKVIGIITNNKKDLFFDYESSNNSNNSNLDICSLILQDQNYYYNLKSYIIDHKNFLKLELSKQETIQQSSVYSMQNLKNSSNCELCDKKLSSKEKEIVDNKLKEKINISINSIENLNSKINIVSELLIELDKCQESINEIFNIKANYDSVNQAIELCDKEINLLKFQLKEYENQSKKLFLELDYLLSNIQLDDIKQIFIESNKVKQFAKSIFKKLMINEQTVENIIYQETNLHNIFVENNTLNQNEISEKLNIFQIKEFLECEHLKIFNSFIKNLETELNEVLTKSINIENEIRTLNEEIFFLETQKSKILNDLNKINKDIRYLDIEKLEKMKGLNHDSKSKTESFEKDLLTKSEEKDNIEELIKKTEISIVQIQVKLDSIKKSISETSYNEYLTKIRKAKLMTEVLIEDSTYKSSESIDDIKERLIVLNGKKNELELSVNYLTQTIEEVYNNYMNKTKEYNNYKKNIELYNLSNELQQIKQELNNLNNESIKYKSFIINKNELKSLLENNKSKYSEKIGQRQEQMNYVNRLKIELNNPNYFNIEMKFNQIKLEFIMTLETIRTIEVYIDSLDKTLIKYHARRMDEVNKLINYYWAMTYKGNDIKQIEIKSEIEKTNNKSRSYYYRIVSTSEK